MLESDTRSLSSKFSGCLCRYEQARARKEAKRKKRSRKSEEEEEEEEGEERLE